MNILLINPGWGKRISRKGRRFNRPWPPLSLMISASLLEKAGFTVRIVDGRVDRGWHAKLKRSAPESDWIGLTSSPLDRWQCPNLEIGYFVDLARSLPSDKLLIMGVHGSIFPQAMLNQTRARAVIVGEPEQRLLALVTLEDWSAIPGIVFRKDGKACQTGRALPTSLSNLPAPAFHLIDPPRYAYELLGRPFALFETSRGCPYGCTFCLKTMYGPGVRYKPIEGLMVEIEQAVTISGFRYGYFIDLEFTTNRERALEICDQLIARNYPFIWCCQTRADAVDAVLLKRMKRAGCRLIHYGVESGSSRILTDTRKRIDGDTIQEGIRLTHEAGIETACFFMLGFPGETRSEMEETIEFARNLNPAYASFHVATPYPGTAIGALTSSSPDAPDSDMSFPTCREGHSPIFLNKMIRKAYISYYVRPAYILARLKQGNPLSLLRQLRLFAGFVR
ncbi:MAG: radical SAM protein [Desulfobacterales bacterium]|nr:radical SAM protein [Desulfobacterales bacterium]